MATFTTRFQDSLLEPLDRLAAAHGLSRNAFLEYLATDAIRKGFIPIKKGEGLRAVGQSGAVITLKLYEGVQTTGQQLLAKPEQLPFLQARKAAMQGNWQQAKRILMSARFVVTHISALSAQESQ